MVNYGDERWWLDSGEEELIETLPDGRRIPKLQDRYHEEYRRMRIGGLDHDIAFDKVMRKHHPSYGTPTIIGMSDTNLLKTAWGVRAQLDDADDKLRSNELIANAKEAGIPTTGKWYAPTLARFPSDPEALVGSYGDMQAICEKRGWSWEMRDGVFIALKPSELVTKVYDVMEGRTPIPANVFGG